MKLLEVDQLKHSYGKNEILKGLSFDIGEGECFALLGPNGAGKTTAISIILNYLNVQSGSVRISGQAHSDFATKSLRSCTPQDARFSGELKVVEVLNYMASLYSNPISTEKIIEDFRLEKILSHNCSSLSGGQRRLLSLASAFIGNCPLVLLDEPTTGLDIEIRFWVWKLLRAYVEGGGSLLLTTHHLEEAEFLSDRVGFLHQGDLVRSGSFADLKSETTTKKISFRYSGEKPLPQHISSSGQQSWVFESFLAENDIKDLLNSFDVSDLRVEDLGIEKLFNNIISKGSKK